MESYSKSPAPSTTTVPSKMKLPVPVVGRSIRRWVLILSVALVVSFAVRAVYVPHASSERLALPAGLVVKMPHCNGCRNERERYGKGPRTLIELPKEVFSKEFKKKETWLVCEYCDGDLLDRALVAHENRTQKP